MTKYKYTFAYILLNAISAVVITFVGHTISVEVMIALSSLYALLFFHCLNIGNFVVMYKKVLTNFKLCSLMISIFGLMWWVCFLIPVYYTPAILMFYATAIPSLLGLFFTFKAKKQRQAQMGFFAILLLIIGFYVALSQSETLTSMALLLLLTLTAGITMYIYSRLSQSMNEIGFKPSEILAIRFTLLTFFAFVYIFKSGALFSISGRDAIFSLLVSIMSLIIPIYFSQISISKVGANDHSILIGFTPFFCFITEAIYYKATYNHSVPVHVDGYFSIALVIVLVIYSVKNVSSQKASMGLRTQAVKNDNINNLRD
ncbi:hypothetical protein [uncultured Shewanella sp.]|uniref:hypothetical protein n=1 Tax=uncultured Shewanella sp. TaxID=173975 RepID=UPI002625E776|nr:hypothetical protein [uncultured Shewanella sp.]